LSGEKPERPNYVELEPALPRWTATREQERSAERDGERERVAKRPSSVEDREEEKEEEDRKRGRGLRREDHPENYRPPVLVKRIE